MNTANRLRNASQCTISVCAALVMAVATAVAMAPPAQAVERIEVQALFKGRAVMLIDGKRRLLKVGQTSPEGVTLRKSNSKGAEIEVDGKRRKLALGRRIGSNFAKPRGQKVRVIGNANGMHLSTGSINGVAVQFLLDTGATFVSINEPDARRIGLDYERLGTRASSTTASGVTRTWRMNLSRVKIGEIELRNVEAAIHPGKFPPIVLLGNSFLSRVKMTKTGADFVLERNF